MLGTQAGQAHATGDDRRFTARFKVDLKVRVQIRSGSTSRTVHGQASDISNGGLALYLPADLTVGETIELEFILPYTTSSVTTLAVVRNRRSYQYGVEYVNLLPSAGAAIRRACVSLALV
jgi:c-di-GMP-binding flagellar brake protein YcgR